MKLGIPETREVIVAFVALLIRTSANLEDDGKVGMLEMPGYAVEIPKLRAALKGISQVPAEFKDLDAEEAALLKDDVIDALNQMGVKHRTQDWVDDIMEWAYNTVALITKVRPPSAVAV